jgi:arylsulfatase A-like enzyme
VTGNPNVLLIVLDSVRASRLSCYGYEEETTPNIDALANMATRYECAISEGCWTMPSHASIFTGMPSTVHGAHAKHRSFDPDNDTLAERLSQVGYTTYGASQNGWVTSENGFDRGFDEFHDRDHAQLFEDQFDIRSAIRRHEDKGSIHRYASFVTDALTSGSPLRALTNLVYFKYRDSRFCDDGASINNRFAKDAMSRDSEPWFVFLNYMEAHEPYYPKSAHRAEFLPEDIPPRSAFDGAGKWDFHAERTDPPFESLKALYDAELRLLDERVGSILDELKEQGELEDTFVVIAGDHGQHFGERGMMGHVASPYPETIHVPLLVSEPGQTSAEVESDPTSVREIFYKILSISSGDTEVNEAHEDVLSHCHGTHEDVFDDYPELDKERWTENLVTKVISTEEGYLASLRGSQDRSERYGFGEQDPSWETSESIGDDIDDKLAVELDHMKVIDDAGDVEVTDRLKDLGYL